MDKWKEQRSPALRTAKTPRDAKEGATNVCLIWCETLASKCDPGNNGVGTVFDRTPESSLVRPTKIDTAPRRALTNELDDILRVVKLTVTKRSGARSTSGSISSSRRNSLDKELVHEHTCQIWWSWQVMVWTTECDVIDPARSHSCMVHEELVLWWFKFTRLCGA